MFLHLFSSLITLLFSASSQTPRFENSKAIDKLDLYTTTATELQTGLEIGLYNSQDLVQAYLKQIAAHNHNGLQLHAIISTVSENLLLSRARELDKEREDKITRSRLHGVPIILKDNTLTGSLGVGTTSGTIALMGSQTKQDASITRLLQQAGCIILGKANLSELGNAKGTNITSGWSPTQSPYVVGGVKSDDTWFGHSTPGDSSSGSAVSVAAGFAPIAIGTETDGSVVWPALRAALYGLKPTCGAVDTTGTQGGRNPFFSAGGLAKNVADIADITDLLIHGSHARSYLSTRWDDIRVALVPKTPWKMPEDMQKVDESFDKQTDSEVLTAFEKIKSLGAEVIFDAPLKTPLELLEIHNLSSIRDMGLYQVKTRLTTFFDYFDDSPVHTLDEFISFNNKNADEELPPAEPNQQYLEDAAALNMTAEQFVHNFHQWQRAMRANIEECFTQTEADVIIAQGESILTTAAMLAGYPIAAVPLGFAESNGRPFGMLIMARANEEGKLVKVMSAWEAAFPHARKPPPLMTELESSLVRQA